MGCGASTSSGKQPHHTMHVGGSQPKAASRANSFNTVSRRASTGPDNRKAVVGQRADRTAYVMLYVSFCTRFVSFRILLVLVLL